MAIPADRMNGGGLERQNHIMISDERLRRLEDRMDRIANALEKLAVLEEKHATLNQTLGRFGNRLEAAEKCITDMQIQSSKNSVYISMVERVVWAILGGSGVVGWVAYFIHLKNVA
jgi:hypothetical protein